MLLHRGKPFFSNWGKAAYHWRIPVKKFNYHTWWISLDIRRIFTYLHTGKNQSLIPGGAGRLRNHVGDLALIGKSNSGIRI